MKKWLAYLVLGACLVIGPVAWAQPKIPPAPTSGSVFVQDYAGVLSEETKTQIDSLGAQLKTQTKAHVVAVTIKSLEGSVLSDYSLAILRQWGVGDKALNNGVVILVAVGDRQSRIEVGYGLEGRLPDAKTGRIQDQYMIPYFQKGDYDQGVLNGYQAVVGEVAQEYGAQIGADATQVAESRPANHNGFWDMLPWWARIIIVVVVLLLFICDWVFWGGALTFLLLSMFRGGGGGGGSGGGGFGGGSGGGGGSDRKW